MINKFVVRLTNQRIHTLNKYIYMHIKYLHIHLLSGSDMRMFVFHNL